MECGKTTLTRTTHKALIRLTDAESEFFEAVTVYRCIREFGHDGEHFGTELQPNETTVVWTDTDPTDVRPSQVGVEPVE